MCVSGMLAIGRKSAEKGGPWHQTFWNRRKVIPNGRKVIPIEVMKKYVEEKG